MGTWTRPTLGCISHLHTTNLATAVQTPLQGWLCPQPHTRTHIGTQALCCRGGWGSAGAWAGVAFSLWSSRGHFKSSHISVLSFPWYKPRRAFSLPSCSAGAP